MLGQRRRPDKTYELTIFCMYQVFTTRGVFRCRRVILTTGAWMNQLLSSLGTHVPMVTVQDQVTYLATPNTKLFTKDK